MHSWRCVQSFSVGVLAVCGSTREGKCTHGAARTRCGGCAHLSMEDRQMFMVMVTSRAGSTVRGVSVSISVRVSIMILSKVLWCN